MADTDTLILAQLTDVQALLCTMYGEARGDSREGNSSVEERLAVGCTIRNRLRMPGRFGDSYRAVCLKPKQFSCWNVGDPNRPILVALAYRLVTGQPSMDPLVDETAYLAEGILRGVVLDRVNGANHYLTTALLRSSPPSWAKGNTPVAVVGHQSFLIA